MANQRDQIAAIVGIAIDQVDNYCQSVRAALPATQAPGNQDIAKALEELRGLNPPLADVAERARKIGQFRRASKIRNRAGAADRLRRPVERKLGLPLTVKRPTALTRCRWCGRPSIPGSDTCYTCSSD